MRSLNPYLLSIHVPSISRYCYSIFSFHKHRPGPRCIKLFARLFFCHRKTLANLYANCNGKKKMPEFLSFCRKKLRQKFYATGPWCPDQAAHNYIQTFGHRWQVEKDDLAQTGNDQNQTGLCRSNTFNSGFQTSQQHSGVYRSSFHFRTDPTIDHLSPSTDTVRSLTKSYAFLVFRKKKLRELK